MLYPLWLLKPSLTRTRGLMAAVAQNWKHVPPHLIMSRRLETRPEYKQYSYSLCKAIKQAKCQYRDKVEPQFNGSNKRRMWQGLQTITDYVTGRQTKPSRTITTRATTCSSRFHPEGQVSTGASKLGQRDWKSQGHQIVKQPLLAQRGRGLPTDLMSLATLIHGSLVTLIMPL
jgi:hypothetical protein